MQTIKIIVTILNILMTLVLFFCVKGLSWKNQKDHASIVGFSFMVLLYMTNIYLMWR